jgi:hypothetical protein
VRICHQPKGDTEGETVVIIAYRSSHEGTCGKMHASERYPVVFG